MDLVAGGNSAFPLNLSWFSVAYDAGYMADDIDNFVGVDDGGGPWVCENWPPALGKIPYQGEDWNGGIFQLSYWHTPFLRTAPDVN